MEEHFDQLLKSGKNSVDGLIQWMKDAKIVDGVKVTEEKAREVFADVADPKNVNVDKFKEALNKLASDHQKTLQEFSDTLAAEGPKFLDALKAGASAFKEALAKK
ncbi:uncharacterized protein [Battus philenor]|uniref:uncharacterized protein n=1 Tax=Battus philenor TaxID=42288 RepID=UPI0035CF9DE6